MDSANRKKNLFLRAWARCRSMGSTSCNSFEKNKSRHCTTRSPPKNKCMQQVSPEGCFSVYVGPEKKRFVIKIELANHPLFKILLEDAELEYGFNSEGPILLPCDVDLFYKVLAEIDSGEEMISSPRWTSLIPCSPSARAINKGYRPFHQSWVLKMNRV